MKIIWVIAINTLRQTIREKTFHNVLIFGLLLMGLGVVVGNITYGYPERVLRSISLSGIVLALDLLAVLLGVSLIHQEIAKKTLFVVLTRPVGRGQYVVGRYCGMLMALLLSLLAMALLYVLVLAMVGGEPSINDGVVLAMAIVEAAVLGGFAVCMSAFSTPTLSAGISLGFWIAAASADDLVRLLKEAPGAVRSLAEGAWYALPALSRFNYRDQAVYAQVIDLHEVLFSASYGIAYASGLVALATIILARRQML